MSLFKRLERWLDLIVAHVGFHGSNSLLERECVRRSEGGLTEPGRQPRGEGARRAKRQVDVAVHRDRLDGRDRWLAAAHGRPSYSSRSSETRIHFFFVSW